MAKTLHRLTELEVRKVKEPGRYADGGNLILQVTVGKRSGKVNKSWVFAYQLGKKLSRKTGKEIPGYHEMGLGAYPKDRGLSEAREKAKELRQLLIDKIDPLQERDRRARAIAADSAKDKTFAEVRAEFIEAHEHEWGGASSVQKWRASLEQDAKPIAALPVSGITIAHVVDMLTPLWTSKPTTAAKTRARLEQVFAYAIVKGYRPRELGNPADATTVKVLLGKVSAKVKQKRERTGRAEHYNALPFLEMPELSAELRKDGSLRAQALEFCILTAARTNEVIGATRSEFSEKGLWVIPAERMKGGREHRIPLSARAQQIVADRLEAHGDRPFDIPEKAMLKLLMALPLTAGRATTHGMRAAFKTWCEESTGFDSKLIEAALAHRLGNSKTESSYMRGDLFEKRRRLMLEWAKFVGDPGNARRTGKVLPLRNAR
jgi:integrase